MSDKKISELVAVTDVQDTDELIIARGGASNKIAASDFRAGISSGRSAGPGVILECVNGKADIDLGVVGSGTEFIKWDTMYDNGDDFNTITELPEGLGLDIPVDGVGHHIYTTEPGVWSFASIAYMPYDPSVVSQFGSNFFPDIMHYNMLTPDRLTPFSNTLIAELPEGKVIFFAFFPSVLSSVTPYGPQQLYANIVRLG